eukprot:CAMPEP_0194272192 /NCGR_PEP_ID=MMETSP0169-20130528/5812_1 /TAXON_ID=218684 /ORGANISM="Corethron pennatum, Strain L29A3" /LENGTH=628 /DNA_ID=CAMNT_0039014795 /DNA_START=158 /DNA_END=2042 /DNA_ORIENTATION=+
MAPVQRPQTEISVSNRHLPVRLHSVRPSLARRSPVAMKDDCSKDLSLFTVPQQMLWMQSFRSISAAALMGLAVILPPPIFNEITNGRSSATEVVAVSDAVLRRPPSSASKLSDATTFEYRPEKLGPIRCPTVPNAGRSSTPQIFGTAGGVYCPRQEGNYGQSRPFSRSTIFGFADTKGDGDKSLIMDLRSPANILKDFNSKRFLELIVPPAFAVEDNLPNGDDKTSSKDDIGIPVLDECWSLINKYALDRTFNGQDWNDVKRTYHQKVYKMYPGLSTSQQINFDETAVTKMINGMVGSLGDKYSRTLDKAAYSYMQKYDLVGIGAILMPNEEGQIMIGAPPVPGTSADEYAFKKGDVILEVNGISTKGLTAFKIIDQINEEDPNSLKITMKIRRVGSQPQKPGDPIEQNYVMRRSSEVVTNPIYYQLNASTGPGKKAVGYIQIKEFNSLVKNSIEKAIVDLKKQGADAFVLDLRGNGGGAFQSAVSIASYFMDDSLAVSVVDSNLESMEFRTPKHDSLIPKDVPVVIWTDKGTASASEVLVGALHDNCRAVVMGEKTFGKGIIQAVYGLQDGSGLVLTVAKYITPSGTSIQGVGIKPDVSSLLPPNLPGLRSNTSTMRFDDVSPLAAK